MACFSASPERPGGLGDRSSRRACARLLAALGLLLALASVPMRPVEAQELSPVCGAGYVDVLGGCAQCKDIFSGCPKGQKVGAGPGLCLPCDNGTVSYFVDSAACVKCSNGTAPNDEQTECECPQGSYLDKASASCLPCAAGYVSTSVNAKACVPCAGGNITNIRRSRCICPAGNFLAVSGACTACPEGQVSTAANSANCSACPAGQTPSATKAACLCPDNMVATLDGSCVCPPGFVATTHGAGNTTCAKCDAGKYSDTPDASTCQACALPYVVNEDQTGCACSTNWVMRLGTCVCPKGFRQNATSKACTKCAAGTFSGSDNAAACDACANPWVLGDANQTSCVCGSGLEPLSYGNGTSTCDCPKGSYKSGASCTRCSATQVSTTVGAAQCANCTAPQVPNANQTACVCIGNWLPDATDASKCVCPAGFFSPSPEECSRCSGNTVSPTANLNACLPCGAGMMPTPARTQCVPVPDTCPAGNRPAPTRDTYPEGASCSDVNGATGPGAVPFDLCGAIKVYDASRASTPIAGLSEGEASAACCVHPVGATCTNVDGRGVTTDTFAACGAGRVYNSAAAATRINGTTDSAARLLCCKMGAAAATSCGDLDGDGAPGPVFDACELGQVYDATQDATRIPSATNYAAMLQCCKFVAGATCGNIDARGSGSFGLCGLVKLYEPALAPVSIAGLTAAKAINKCCLYPANATCTSVDGRGTDFAACGTGQTYDDADSSIKNLRINGTTEDVAASTCCKYTAASATCGDIDGDGTPGPSFGVCAAGKEYGSTSSATSISGDQDAEADAKCCKYASGATCGVADGASATLSACGATKLYDATQAAESIAGLFDSAAAKLCCAYNTNATCGDTDADNSAGPTFAATCPADYTYNSSSTSISIAGKTDAAAAPDCCQVRYPVGTNCTNLGADPAAVCATYSSKVPSTDALPTEIANATEAAAAALCCQHNASATCGDVNGDGVAGPTFGACGSGRLYDSSTSNTDISGLLDSAAVSKCCKFASGRTCGNVDGEGSVWQSAWCDAIKEYDSSLADESIAGLLPTAAAAVCCVYKSGAKCGNLDGNITTSENFTACPSANMLYSVSADAVAINGRTDAGAIPYCCEYKYPEGATCANSTAVNPTVAFSACASQGSKVAISPAPATSITTLSEAAAAAVCCQHNSSATCGDTDGDGAAGPAFAVCGLGTEYVSSSVNVTIDGITDADAAIKCCTFVTGATCGDIDGSGTVNGSFPDASCGSLKEYDASQFDVAIAGLYASQAASKCCKFKAGATCGDTDGDGSAGPTFSTCSASLNKLYDSAQAAVAISGLTDEAVRALCCKHAASTTCANADGSGTAFSACGTVKRYAGPWSPSAPAIAGLTDAAAAPLCCGYPVTATCGDVDGAGPDTAHFALCGSAKVPAPARHGLSIAGLVDTDANLRCCEYPAGATCADTDGSSASATPPFACGAVLTPAAGQGGTPIASLTEEPARTVCCAYPSTATCGNTRLGGAFNTCPPQATPSANATVLATSIAGLTLAAAAPVCCKSLFAANATCGNTNGLGASYTCSAPAISSSGRTNVSITGLSSVDASALCCVYPAGAKCGDVAGDGSLSEFQRCGPGRKFDITLGNTAINGTTDADAAPRCCMAAYTCMLCNAGLFADGSTCSPCPAGKVSQAGAAACTACGAGMVPNEQRTACVCQSADTMQQVGNVCVCKPGYVADGAGGCVQCPASMVAPLANATSCYACPPGLVASSGQAGCECPAPLQLACETGACVCPAGYFRDIKANLTCKRCAAGTNSSAPDAFLCTSGAVVVQPGVNASAGLPVAVSKFTMTFAMEFAQLSDPALKAAFQATLAAVVAKAAKVSQELVTVTNLREGSVIADVLVTSPAGAEAQDALLSTLTANPKTLFSADFLDTFGISGVAGMREYTTDTPAATPPPAGGDAPAAGGGPSNTVKLGVGIGVGVGGAAALAGVGTAIVMARRHKQAVVAM